MIERGKISAFQMGAMMNPTIVATAILLVPALTACRADRDMWVSPIWASFVGFLTVYIAYRLNKLYPKETLIEYSEHIIGRIPGKVLGLLYLLFYLHDTGIVVREYGEFIAGTFLQRTPILVIMGGMLVVVSFNVRGGLEVMARSAQIFIPLVIILYLAIIILLIPDLDPGNMLPIMEHGVGPSLMGSLVPQGWFSEIILITFMLPYLKDREKGMKWGMLSVASVLFLMLITNITALFLFDGISDSLTFPVMIAARYISIADFFEHLEAIVMAIWVAGTFIKISTFFYALMLGTAQWLKLSSYRPIALPLGFLVLLFSYWSATSLQELVHFFLITSPFYYVLLQTLLPLLLLVIALLKKKLQKPAGGNQP